MIKFTETNWRPFIELTDLGTRNTVYFDVTTVLCIVQGNGYTTIYLKNNEHLFVKESAEDIIKAVDKMIEEEAARKTEQARKFMEDTQKRVKEFGEKMQ